VTLKREPILGIAQLGETKPPDGGQPPAGANTAINEPIRSGVQLWWHRISVLLFVFFCAVLGVVLVVFPWRDEWTSNIILTNYPALQDFVANGFVRGLCTGLGLVDIWIGFWEAVHYHE